MEYTLLLFSLLAILVFLAFYYVNPVKRDRWLYAKTGWGIFGYSFGLIICILLTIWTIAEFCEITPDQIIATQSDLNGVHQNIHTLWNILCQFADPGNIPHSSQSGNWIALISALAGIVCLSGLLVSSLVSMISHTTHKWRQGLVMYRYGFDKYVIVIGFNEQTASIVRQSLNREGVKFVLIQTRKNVEEARMALELKMNDKLEDRIVFYAGERTSAEDLAKLRPEKAVEIYILGEDSDYIGEKDHDSFNVNCLEHISNYIKKHKQHHPDWKKRIRVHVNFEYQSTFTAFKATQLYQKLDKDLEFVPFNVHEIWAKKVLVDNFAIIPAGMNGEFKVQRYKPIDTYRDECTGKQVGITKDCDKQVHLIILGMNQMGTALATQTALLCHFPNFTQKNKIRTTITFIDDHAKEEADYFMGRFSTLFSLCRHRIVICDKKNNTNSGVSPEGSPRVSYSLDAPFFDPMSQVDEHGEGLYNHLVGENDVKNESFLDIDWEFIQGNAASAEIQNYITKLTNDPQKTTTVAICFNSSQQAIASAMYLPQDVYKKANQVLVYQQNCFDIIEDITNGDAEWRRYPNMYPFGMIEGSYTENQFDNHIAKLINKIYLGNIIKDENLLKSIDKDWDQLDIVGKLANIHLADSIQVKFRSMGISSLNDKKAILKDITEMAASEHLRWTTERLMTGFRALTKAEQEPFIKQRFNIQGEQNQKKKMYINEERAHLDICSQDRLKDVDPIVYDRDQDRKIIFSLQEILKAAEWASILRLSSPRYQQSQHVRFLRYFLTNDTRNKLAFRFIKGVAGDKKMVDKTNHSFWMSVSPVTEAQWEKVMGVRKNLTVNRIQRFLHGNMPVVNVSKQEVDDFLDILRKRSGLTFELPSKKEWLYAAHMTLDSVQTKSGAYRTHISRPGSPKRMPTRVGRYASGQKSGTGLRHIIGNVWQWTRDEDQYHRFEFCGGSWRFTERETDLNQDYWHNSWEKEMKSDDLGFRLIWKFDLEYLGSKKLEELLTQQKDTTTDNITLIQNWFNNGVQLETHDRRSRMIPVKAGRFVMGANETQDASADKNERPRHIVEIPYNYYVCDIPVTQSLWNLVMSDKNNPTTNRYGDNLPQTDITWNDVQTFIQNLNNIRDRLALQLPEETQNMVFRLPTEAEWEYAAKNGHLDTDLINDAALVVPKRVGDEGEEECPYKVFDVAYKLYSGSDVATEVAWFEEPVIKNVALKKPNALGLFDMSGNVWEWCHDFYIWDMYDQGNVCYPLAPEDQGYAAHVFRGGSWRSTMWDCRCTRANFWTATHKSNDLGFRLVLGRPIDPNNCNKPISANK